MLAAAVLSLAACNDVKSAPDAEPTTGLVILGDGTTMTARKGTLSRAVADWLAADTAAPKYFDLGAHSFVPGTARLSRQGLGRAADLGTLLRSTPDAHLVLASAPDAADGKLFHSRATTLAKFLGKRGILAGQVTIESNTSVRTQPGAETDGLPFLLRRRGSAVEGSSPQSVTAETRPETMTKYGPILG